MYHALKKSGHEVRVFNVDPTPRKYEFLIQDVEVQYYENNPVLPKAVDLTLVFDTNDERQLAGLFTPLRKVSKHMAFIDHHPRRVHGPQPTPESWVDSTAASTGELAFRLIQGLRIPLDETISRALYASIAFDTQLFRYIRGSKTSHEIAVELLKHPFQPELVHRHLFGGQTAQKMAFLAKALAQIEYHLEGQLAVLKLKDQDLFHYNLEPDEARDVVDMVMNIESLEAAALFREDAPNEYKLSLRSKGHLSVLDIAEKFGGGGHHYSAGAHVKGAYEVLKKSVVDSIRTSLKKAS